MSRVSTYDRLASRVMVAPEKMVVDREVLQRLLKEFRLLFFACTAAEVMLNDTGVTSGPVFESVRKALAAASKALHDE